jgi:hypothetical protein
VFQVNHYTSESGHIDTPKGGDIGSGGGCGNDFRVGSGSGGGGV